MRGVRGVYYYISYLASEPAVKDSYLGFRRSLSNLGWSARESSHPDILRRVWAVVEECDKPNLVWVLYSQIWVLELFSHILCVCSAELWVSRRGADAWSVRSISRAAISHILLQGLVLVYIIIVRVKLCMFLLWVWFVTDWTYVEMPVSDSRSFMQRCNIRRPDACACNVAWAKYWKR